MFARSITKAKLAYIPLFLFLNSLQAQDFYNEDSIQLIKIYFDYQDWDYRLDTAKAGKENYILARYCTVNGQRFDSVGVKYKGNSSYRNTQVKNPLHIKLDWTISNQEYNDISSIKLGNNFADPSAVREVMSYEILRNYMDCSKANFSKLYINDKYIGLYTNVETVNKKFCSEHFGSSDHVFVKGNPDRPGANSTSNLVYINKDSSSYYAYYGMENGYGWSKLIALMDTLKNNSNNLEKIVDIDRSIWMHAFNSVFSNYDSYTGSFSQNYYLYEDDFGRFLPVIWDLNMSIGGFPGMGGATTTDKIPFFNGETNAARPLIQKILQNARYKKMYTAHVRTFCKEFISNKEYQNIAKRLQAKVDTIVKNDPNSLTTYSAFLTSLTAPISSGGGPGGSAPGIYTLMEARLAYFNTVAEFKSVPPVIGMPVLSTQAVTIGDSTWIRVAVSNCNYVYIASRKNKYGLFLKQTMWDDGLHHDGAAGDGMYGAFVIPETKKTQYYIYAENNSAGVFSPERAEYEFYTINANIPYQDIKAGNIVINELMSVNRNTVKDTTDDNYEDWLEILNTTNESLDISGFYLSDEFSNSTKWEFPKATVIPANQRIIVWLDEDSNTTLGGIHANFKLSSAGEELIFSRPDGLVLDSLHFGVIPADYSLERCPDGTGDFIVTAHSTFNQVNCIINQVSNDALSSIKYYPNPVQGILYIDVADIDPIKLYIMDLKGVNQCQHTLYNSTTYRISTQNLVPGFYILKVVNGKGEACNQKILVY